MRLGRLLRLLCLALPMVLGLAEGGKRPLPAPGPNGVLAISAPTQSLPTPVHNEATCAFCQAAIFPPCAPQPAQIALGEQGLIEVERPVPDARVPHLSAARPPSSRAPPTLRAA